MNRLLHQINGVRVLLSLTHLLLHLWQEPRRLASVKNSFGLRYHILSVVCGQHIVKVQGQFVPLELPLLALIFLHYERLTNLDLTFTL